MIPTKSIKTYLNFPNRAIKKKNNFFQPQILKISFSTFSATKNNSNKFEDSHKFLPHLFFIFFFLLNIFLVSTNISEKKNAKFLWTARIFLFLFHPSNMSLQKSSCNWLCIFQYFTTTLVEKALIWMINWVIEFFH